MSDGTQSVPEDDAAFEPIVVPNSNPASLFSHYEVHPYPPTGSAKLIGRYRSDTDGSAQHVTIAISEKKHALDLLRALNGPIPEEHD